MKVESGTGNGYYAHVNAENSLSVAATTVSRQHYAAKVNQRSFQVIGEATAANGTVNVLHLTNNSSNQTYTVTYIRLSTIDLAGGTAPPSAANYFEVGTGLTYTSGGSQVDEVNTYLGSVVTAQGSFYDTNPTLSGTMAVLDKHRCKADGDEHTYNKEGSVIIPPGGSMTIRFTSDNTSGEVYCRVSFYVSDIDSLST